MALDAAAEVVVRPNGGDGSLVGAVARAMKRVVRRLLRSELSRQTAFNHASVRVAADLAARLDGVLDADGQVRPEAIAVPLATLDRLAGDLVRIAEQVRALRADVDAARAAATARADALEERLSAVVAPRLGALEERLAACVHAIETFGGSTLGAFNARLVTVERRVRRVVHLLESPDADAAAARAARPPLAEPVEPVLDNLSFEDHFRGTEADIRERQRVYLEWFRTGGQVIDVGCGRGEFLELLRDAGIPAIGVDTDLDVVLACREKGLHVVHADVMEYLRTLPDASLGGIFAAQVVEHLEGPQIVVLVKLCHRKLQPGGVLVLETVNPTCLTVFAESFYMDLTHVRPVHPAALQFVARTAGFGETTIHWSSPVDADVRLPPLPANGADAEAIERFNRAVARLNDLLYGYRDYAVIARKVPPGAGMRAP